MYKRNSFLKFGWVKTSVMISFFLIVSNACCYFDPQIKGMSFLRRFIIEPIISKYPSMRFQKKPIMSLKALILVWLVDGSYSTIALILSKSADTPS